MKKYKAVFFDWDGTAVISRKASVDEIVPILENVLSRDIKLFIISGTTYNNIAHGNLEKLLSKNALQNLYLGLGRGAFNYKFSEKGNLEIAKSYVPTKDILVKIHDVSYSIHKKLFLEYNFQTDIIFSRPNYCKIDLMVEHTRGDNLFLQDGELESINNLLNEHGYSKGLKNILDECVRIGMDLGIEVKVTTDTKYLEIGNTTKADNINYLLNEFVLTKGIKINECCFFGDEFSYLGKDIKGSDAFMITDLSQDADFFDVSKNPYELPTNVVSLGGGIDSFIDFLKNL